MGRIVACWHHGDLARLNYHLKHGRIDVYGTDEVTERGQNRLNRFCRHMRLQAGETIRIRIKDKIYYTAVIENPKPYTLPHSECEDIWTSAIDLENITPKNPPELADCYPIHQGSHRLVQSQQGNQPPRQDFIRREKYAFKEDRQMATKSIDINEQLYERLYRVVGTKLKSPKESYAKAIQSAVEEALTRFLDSLEGNDNKVDKT